MFLLTQGTIADSEAFYALDDHHVFEAHRPMLVCGNTAAMVQDSWLKKHFSVVGSRETHFGLFDCSTPPSVGPMADASSSGGACC